jgi:hypothetical protein
MVRGDCSYTAVVRGLNPPQVVVDVEPNIPFLPWSVDRVQRVEARTGDLVGAHVVAL